MVLHSNSSEEYIQKLAQERKEPMIKILNTLRENLPKGFEETITYGMISFVVPHSKYPQGYHCDPKLPLGFISLASQKNYISLYHMGIYADEAIMNWFVSEYSKLNIGKLDMGKSCIRFKKADNIPYQLLADLASKINCDQWISMYESNFKK